jgi:uncharacterized small protein (DUF1192 family)
MNTEHDWLVWWHDEGSGMRPVNGQDHEEHVRDMTRIAWLNGAFGAADEIERLRTQLEMWQDGNIMAESHRDEIERLTAERDEARRMCCEQAAMDESGYVKHGDMLHFAESRGWDCFQQEDNK